MTEYNKISIDKAIKSDKTISKKESKLIHALLRGRHEEYKIIRFRRNPTTGEISRRTIKTGMTEAQAKAHCSKEETHGLNWFDGFDKVKGAL